jgi:hypothetical protein
MTKNFDKAAFEVAFSTSIIALITSERVTKAELQVCSRTVLEAVHATGDIGYANRLIDVLTPVNKKVCIVFMKHFTGFSFDDKLNLFHKKSKKRYEQAHKDAMEFLDDPMNNIWSWAARNIEVQAKEFTLDLVTKSVEGYLKKANANGISQADVMRAILKGGITSDAILAIMGDIGYDVGIQDDNPANKSMSDTLGEALV